jgi:cation-transporting ATPase 13A1
MCGDGGNDVGALKAADVGVALLQNEQQQNPKAVGNDEKDTIVNIGDASIAAPFTSRNSSIHAVLHILKYGRSTQALILQNYQSTALDCLLNGYSLSVLYLQDAKYSSIQLTALSMISYFVNFGYFMVKPLDKLSSIPMPLTVFNKAMVMKVVAYLVAFITAMSISKKLVSDSVPADLITSYFKPNSISNVVFLFTILQLVTVPAITFLGQPFLKELHKINVIFIPMLLSLGLIAILSFNLIPSLNDLLQFANDLSYYKRLLLMMILYGTTSFMFIIDRLLLFVFSKEIFYRKMHN